MNDFLEAKRPSCPHCEWEDPEAKGYLRLDPAFPDASRFWHCAFCWRFYESDLLGKDLQEGDAPPGFLGDAGPAFDDIPW